MDAKTLAGLIDSTMLAAAATEDDIRALAVDAARRGFATVCVPPCHVPLAVRLLDGSGTRVCTVAGFPFGYQGPGVKLMEATAACGEGASEIDMVMNVSLFRSGNVATVAREIGSVVKAVAGAVVKVIIEAALLTDAQKAEACAMAVAQGAHFVKTSTGFGPGGATVADVRLLVKAGGGKTKVKAAGGIRDLDTTLAMINAGAQRIGTSSAAGIMDEFAAAAGNQ